MAPLRSHSQIQSRSGGFTGHLGSVVLPGINGTVPRPWGGHSGWTAIPGGQQSCCTGRLKQGSLGAGDLQVPSTSWKYQVPDLSCLGLAWPGAHLLKVQALVAWRLSVALCWAPAHSVGSPPEAIDRQCHLLS